MPPLIVFSTRKIPSKSKLSSTLKQLAKVSVKRFLISFKNSFIIHQMFQFLLQNRQCGYYKYYPVEDEERGEFCYLLRSCSKRMTDNINCPLGKNNFLEVKFFVPTLEECAEHCRDTQGCRYYWWYSIENSQSPLYCYLYQQCAASDKEPEAALVIGGRHPGHYFMTENEHNDLIMRYLTLSTGCQNLAKSEL